MSPPQTYLLSKGQGQAREPGFPLWPAFWLCDWLCDWGKSQGSEVTQQRPPIPAWREHSIAKGKPRLGHRTSMGGGTHVGQCQRAATAALIGLLVAAQLREGPRLAEQRTDVLAIQAQRLLAVLQRLLIQALQRESSRWPRSAPPNLSLSLASPPYRDGARLGSEYARGSRKQLFSSDSSPGHLRFQTEGPPQPPGVAGHQN